MKIWVSHPSITTKITSLPDMDDVQSIDGSSGTYRTGSEADPPTAALEALHRAHQDIHNALAAWLRKEGFPDLLVAESSSWRDCDKPLCLDASRAAENSRAALLSYLRDRSHDYKVCSLGLNAASSAISVFEGAAGHPRPTFSRDRRESTRRQSVHERGGHDILGSRGDAGVDPELTKALLDGWAAGFTGRR